METNMVQRSFVCISNYSWGRGKTAEEALKNCKVNLPHYAKHGLLQLLEGSHDYDAVYVNGLGGLVHPKGLTIVDIGFVTLSVSGRIHIKDKLKEESH